MTHQRHITLTPIGQHIAATQSNLLRVVAFASLMAFAVTTAHALADWNHQQEIAARV